MYILKGLSIFWAILFIVLGVFWPNQSEAPAPTNLDDIISAIFLAVAAISFLFFLLTYALEHLFEKYLTAYAKRGRV